MTFESMAARAALRQRSRELLREFETVAREYAATLPLDERLRLSVPLAQLLAALSGEVTAPPSKRLVMVGAMGPDLGESLEVVAWRAGLRGGK